MVFNPLPPPPAHAKMPCFMAFHPLEETPSHTGETLGSKRHGPCRFPCNPNVMDVGTTRKWSYKDFLLKEGQIILNFV